MPNAKELKWETCHGKSEEEKGGHFEHRYREWTFIKVGWRYSQETYLGLGTENVAYGRL